MKQSELVKKLTDNELKKSLYMSQLLFLCLALMLSLFLFDNITHWTFLFKLNIKEILIFGSCSGIVIVLFDLAMMSIFPKRYYDDGGINDRIFKRLTVKEIALTCVLIAISEELLFRGVLQTTLGYIPASIIFTVVHIRYLSKPVLFASVLIVSFYIGFLFELTNNLYVTIFAHFTIDFVLGIIIHFQKRGVNND